jgi:hypothetical protein
MREEQDLFGWRQPIDPFAEMRRVVSSTVPCAGTPIPPEEFIEIRRRGLRAGNLDHLRNHSRTSSQHSW